MTGQLRRLNPIQIVWYSMGEATEFQAVDTRQQEARNLRAATGCL